MRFTRVCSDPSTQDYTQVCSDPGFKRTTRLTEIAAGSSCRLARALPKTSASCNSTCNEWFNQRLNIHESSRQTIQNFAAAVYSDLPRQSRMMLASRGFAQTPRLKRPIEHCCLRPNLLLSSIPRLTRHVAATRVIKICID